MKRLNNDDQTHVPLLRVRQLAMIVAVGALLVAGPLTAVWKQASITQISIQQKRLSDSLAVLNKQAAQLRLSIDKLSATSRIETIARTCRGLEYPSANRIVIIKERSADHRQRAGRDNHIAAIRRAITREKG